MAKKRGRKKKIPKEPGKTFKTFEERFDFMINRFSVQAVYKDRGNGDGLTHFYFFVTDNGRAALEVAADFSCEAEFERRKYRFIADLYTNKLHDDSYASQYGKLHLGKLLENGQVIV